MNRARDRLARLDAHALAGDGTAAAWRRVRVPIATGEDEGDAFPPALARLHLTDLASARTRDRAPCFLAAPAAFGAGP
jgi:hypothetical protein